MTIQRQLLTVHLECLVFESTNRRVQAGGLPHETTLLCDPTTVCKAWQYRITTYMQKKRPESEMRRLHIK